MKRRHSADPSDIASISGRPFNYRRTSFTAAPVWSHSLSGMGDSTTDDQTLTQEAKSFWDKIISVLPWFGSGRAEADIIAPVQNQLDSIMDGITQKILTGQSPSLAELQVMAKTLKQAAAYYYAFVTDPRFTDGRASQQGLNDMMPLIDGTCGYQRFAFQPTQFNCLTWGEGTIGGPGTNGQLGALQRAITAKGGTLTIPPIGTLPITPLPTGGGTLLGGLSGPMVLVGVLAIYLFSRRSR